MKRLRMKIGHFWKRLCTGRVVSGKLTSILTTDPSTPALLKSKTFPRKDRQQ